MELWVFALAFKQNLGGRKKEREGRKRGEGGGEGKGSVRKGGETRGDKRRREESQVLAPITETFI